ncbi:MAG: DegT/DnrJ/EryC1/StrS family aminotransferase, partial [bacterium]|nr:DegT/DnrJ/EryC1/StrS family aminotransferase [bacterium]
MKVEFVNLKRQNEAHWIEFNSAISNVIKKADFIQGEELDSFEANFAKYCGVKYAIGLNSGTDALFFALLANNIGKGDEVITVVNSYFSSAMVISQTGAKPVLVDVRSDNFNMDIDLIERSITKHTKAIIPVHLCGQPADMDPISELAKKHKLIVIEDACQAHGAKYKGKRVPVTGTGAFSFYPGKNLGSFGDGGALITDDKDIAKKTLLLRNDGSITKYKHEQLGYKSRLDTLQAAVLDVKLKHLTNWNT